MSLSRPSAGRYQFENGLENGLVLCELSKRYFSEAVCIRLTMTKARDRNPDAITQKDGREGYPLCKAIREMSSHYKYSPHPVVCIHFEAFQARAANDLSTSGPVTTTSFMFSINSLALFSTSSDKPSPEATDSLASPAFHMRC